MSYELIMRGPPNRSLLKVPMKGVYVNVHLGVDTSSWEERATECPHCGRQP